MKSEEPKCNFCGKTREEAHYFIAGEGVYICEECIEACVGILNSQNSLFVHVRVGNDNSIYLRIPGTEDASKHYNFKVPESYSTGGSVAVMLYKLLRFLQHGKINAVVKSLQDERDALLAVLGEEGQKIKAINERIAAIQETGDWRAELKAVDDSAVDAGEGDIHVVEKGDEL